MNLINKRLLQQKISNFEFPSPEKLAVSKKLLENWQKALKDSDLEKTKEKSVQGKFLSTFLEDILGYSDVTTGQEEWTLIQHPRIENDSKEPDGSLGWFTKDKKQTRAVIELKDAKAQLDKKQNRGVEKLTPIEQAYLYATKYEGCNWIIVSNFKEIRLYNKHKTQEYYEKFDVIDLIQEQEFKRFYFLLSKENLITKDTESIVDILAKDTMAVEQDITKKFYSEYSQIRINLLKHLSEHNTEIDKVVLLKKAQKLLDRLVFTLFCEDTSSLLPINIVKNTYERAMNSLSPSDERVWSEFKGLFIAIDKGNDRVKPSINAFNGGLFAFDSILDTLSIKDDIWKQIITLAEYDFETDLNVNILGHIFEQSISDLESIKSTLLDEEQDKTKSKRKKDGIFYTPEYITKYIVENTIGKYLEENPDKLSTIKVLDPACGSGSMLNQAHSYLLKEYQLRHEAKLNELDKKGEAQTLFDLNPAETNRGILLNNLFGVDLNQESVEITKLALWLKTARSTEPLQNLDKNIKCGNSLIDDPEIAGAKAFNWNEQYKEVMEEGGFDVIIGNPPYVRQESLPAIEKAWMIENYSEVGDGIADLYVYFFAQALRLLNNGGLLGFIAPNKWMERSYGTKLRKYLKEFEIIGICNLANLKVFEDAVADPSIIIIKKIKSNSDISYRVVNTENDFVNSSLTSTHKIQKAHLDDNIWRFVDPKIQGILEKYKSNSVTLKEYTNGGVYYGIKTGFNEAFIISKEIRDEIVAKDPKSTEIIKPMLEGDDFNSWNLKTPTRYMIATGTNLDIYNKYKGVYEWLIKFQDQLEKRQDKGKNWWNLRACDYYTELDKPKIIYYHTAINHHFYYDSDGYYISANCYFISNADTYIQALLNSKVFNFLKGYLFPHFGDVEKSRGVRLDANKMYNLPIPKATSETKNNFNKLAIQISLKSKVLYNLKESVVTFIHQEYGLCLTTIQIKAFTELGWNQISELLTKQKIHLSIEKKEEFSKWLKEKQKTISVLQAEVSAIDFQINQEVYKLYGLTDEEIKLIEK